MNGKCIDIGTIQAFMDGETAQDESLRVGRHIAGCESCTRLLAVAEDENSFVFSALEREMNALVPTQRLWSRINDSIEVEKSRRPLWDQIFGLISTSLSSPSLTAAAGVLIVFGFAAIVWTVKPDTQEVANRIAEFPQTRPETPVNQPDPKSSGFQEVTETAPSSEPAAVPPTYVKAGKLSNEQLKALAREANDRNRIRPITLDYNAPLPGENTYIKTIADLKQNVDGRKDAVITGSSRVAFERDLAVVNDSIRRLQKVVRKNPRNQAARQVLYSSYQDKIDLLNSVAQKDELLAAVR